MFEVYRSQMLVQVVLLAIAAVLLLSGFVLVWLGRRGARIDRHPVCGGCGYDLLMMGMDRERCPECGRCLRGWRGIKFGNRRQKGWMVYWGLMLLLPGVCVLGLEISVWLSDRPLVTMTPSKVLIYEMVYSEHAEDHDEIVDELINRGVGGALSVDELEELLDEMLRRDRSWLLEREPRFTEVLLRSHDAGLMDEMHCELLAEKILPVIEVEVDDIVYVGSDLPVRIQMRGDLLGMTGGGGPYELRYRTAYSFDEQPSFHRYEQSYTVQKHVVGFEEKLHLSRQRIAEQNLEINEKHKVAVVIEASLIDVVTKKKVYAWQQVVERSFELRARQIKQVRSEEIADQLREAITSSLSQESPHLSMKTDDAMFYVQLHCRAVAYPLYHAVYLQLDHQLPRKVGEMRGYGPWEMTVGDAFRPEQRPQTLTLRLVPLLDEAEAYGKYAEMFGEEVVVEGFPFPQDDDLEWEYADGVDELFDLVEHGEDYLKED
ncbi:hypothetical protein [Poriferisphaera sp. WC338]|uniref:hypothetical protein n=1 Tax=Poriferisphaera sp. WC338 TaxID=3425129 RepID=UPI003D81BBCB